MECPVKRPSCLRTPKPEPPSNQCCCCPCGPPDPPVCPCEPCPPCPPCCPKPCTILALLGKPGPCPFSDSFLPDTDLDFDVDMELMDWGISTPEGFNYEKNRKKFIINKPITCCDCCECIEDGGVECANGDCIFAPQSSEMCYDSDEKDVCPTQRKKVCSLPPCSRKWDQNADTCVTRQGDEPLPSCLPTYDGSCRPSPFCIRTHSPCFIPNCMRCYGCPPPACVCLDEPTAVKKSLVYRSPDEPKPVRQSLPEVESKFAPCPYAPEPQNCCQNNSPKTDETSKNVDHESISHEPQPPCPLRPKCPPCPAASKCPPCPTPPNCPPCEEDTNTDITDGNTEDDTSEAAVSPEQNKGCPKSSCCCQSKKSSASGEVEPQTNVIDRLETPPCPLGCEKSSDSKNGKGKKCPCKETQDYCPVKTEACKLFPKGRCPMGDLGTCDCDYPVPPCMAPPKCGDMPDAPEQYCVKEECCMGLPFPPTQPSVRDDQYGQEVYYKFCDRKPGREETKHYVEISEEPLDNDIFPKRERQHPTWTIISHGKGYEKCKTVQDILRRRGPSKNLSLQYEDKDCPLNPHDIASIGESRVSHPKS